MITRRNEEVDNQPLLWQQSRNYRWPFKAWLFSPWTKTEKALTGLVMVNIVTVVMVLAIDVTWQPNSNNVHATTSASTTALEEIDVDATYRKETEIGKSEQLSKMTKTTHPKPMGKTEVRNPLIQNTRKGKSITTPEPSLDFLSLLKPVFHLSGVQFPQGTVDSSGVATVKYWAETEGSESHFRHARNDYGNGYFLIPQTGHYFVNSHVVFFVDESNTKHQRESCRHNLSRYNALTMREEDIFVNTIAECGHDASNLDYPSDLRGIVLLNVGDLLSVKVSCLSLLTQNRDWHYFEVFLI